MSSDSDREELQSKRYEMISGLTLAVLAAVLAVADLGGGKYGDDEIIGTNEKASAYAWYQAKSLKQTVLEQQKQLLEALITAGSIAPEAKAGVDAQIQSLETDITRYKAEKKEIMEGSDAVGPEGQVLEKDGTPGPVVGAKEWEQRLEVLGRAGDVFDLSTLFLQLCLVLGAVGIVLHQPKMRWLFYAAMVGTGVIGSVYAVQAYGIVGAI